MSANVLDVVQATLDKRGLRDVKFFFSEVKLPHSDVANRIAHVLGTYLDKHYVELEPFGDSKGALDKK